MAQNSVGANSTRLRKTQVEFAAAGGVQKRAQVSYEGGDRLPDCGYLGRIAALGVDVLYVLNGSKNLLGAAVSCLLPAGELVTLCRLGHSHFPELDGQLVAQLRTPDGRVLTLAGLSSDEIKAAADHIGEKISIAIVSAQQAKPGAAG